METLNPSANSQLLKSIHEYSQYNGTECINHLNELMHNFTNRNDDIAALVAAKRNYDKADDSEAKELYLKQVLDVVDGLDVFTEHYLKELRFSVIQANKLLTEIAVLNAKSENKNSNN